MADGMPKASSPDPFPRDMAQRLHGSRLGEAFRLLVLGDPEVVTLTQTAAAHAKQCKLILEGAFPGGFTSYQWPLQLSADELADACVYPGYAIFPGPPLPKPTKAVLELSGAIVRRLALFRQRLASGQLRASGTFVRNGNFGPIHQAQWERPNIVIDTQSSDLLEITNGKAMVQWSGIIIELPELFHVNTAKPLEARSSPPVYDPAPTKKKTSQRASIQQAIATLWPNGIPDAIPVQVRDRKINDWQRKNGLAVASSKTIQRYLAPKAVS
jgi:hypothetical protein